MTETPEQAEFTTGQAAEWLSARGLRMSSRKVIRLFDAGIIVGTKTPGGDRRIGLSALEKYRREHS